MSKLRSGHTSLLGLSYSSRARSHLPPAVLARIEQQASDFNRLYELTGELHFKNGRFRHMLEGPTSVLLPLAARIFSDPRHHEISVESFEAIDRRRFQTWSTSGFHCTAYAWLRETPECDKVSVLMPSTSRDSRADQLQKLSAQLLRF